MTTSNPPFDLDRIVGADDASSIRALAEDIRGLESCLDQVIGAHFRLGNHARAHEIANGTYSLIRAAALLDRVSDELEDRP